MKKLLRAALVAGLAAAVAGCGAGSSGEPSVAEPTDAAPTEIVVPAGVTLSKYGADLGFGEPATVGYAPNDKRSTVLRLTVRSVTQGSIEDLGRYTLNDRLRASTPFYVKVDVENLGPGDVGRTPVPLALEDDRDALILPSTFTDTFEKCPSTPFPSTFAPAATASLCLVYLTPEGGTFNAMSFRPSQAFEPIRWTGELTVPEPVTGEGSKPRKKGAKKGAES